MLSHDIVWKFVTLVIDRLSISCFHVQPFTVTERRIGCNSLNDKLISFLEAQLWDLDMLERQDAIS